MGALIAAVATTSNIANYECNAVAQNTNQTIYITSDGQRIATFPTNVPVDNTIDFWDNPDNCTLIKAAWGLAIANIIMFFITAILAVIIYKQNEEEMNKGRIVVVEDAPVVEKVYTEPAGYPERPRQARRSHGRHPRSSRSSRSPRPRSYVYDDGL